MLISFLTILKKKTKNNFVLCYKWGSINLKLISFLITLKEKKKHLMTTAEALPKRNRNRLKDSITDPIIVKRTFLNS